MNKYSVSWTIGFGNNCHGGNKKNVIWNDISQRLTEVREHNAGTVTLDLLDGPEIGPQSLQLQLDQGYSILTLGDDNGEDYVVRSYLNPNANAGQTEILGNSWDSQQICTDFDLVIKIFEEFFETGDVSRQLLG